MHDHFDTLSNFIDCGSTWAVDNFYGLRTERMIKGGKYKQFRSIFEHIAGISIVTAVGRCWNSAIFLLTKND